MQSVNGNNTHLTSKRVHTATRPIPYPFKPFMSTAKGPLPNPPATNVPLRNTATRMRSGRDRDGNSGKPHLACRVGTC